MWFNGLKHLDESEPFSTTQGDRFTELIAEKALPWNRAFDGAAACIDTDLPQRKVGALRLTLLSPDRDKLRALRPRWLRECRDAELVSGERREREREEDIEFFGAPNVEKLASVPFERDVAPANGSSIALLVEWRDRRLLLAADAHEDRLRKSLLQLGATPASPLRLDVFKVSHHGSANNISRELIERVDCRAFLFSSSGAYFAHPSPVAVARVVRYARRPTTLAFNYSSKQTQPWGGDSVTARYQYEVDYGIDGTWCRFAPSWSHSAGSFSASWSR